MAWAAEKDSGFRQTAVAHDGTTLAGARNAVFEKIIDDEVIAVEENNTPMSRPVDRIDARSVVRIADLAGKRAESATAGNLVSSFTAADGGSGSITFGPLVPRGFTIAQDRNIGGHYLEQEYRMEGSALTETVVI